MKFISAVIRPGPAAALCTVLFAGLAIATAAEKPYRREPLSDGVHLFRPLDHSIERTNSLVVERSDGLLVVESQPSPEAAAQLLAQIGEWNPGPVRFLVLSHSHAESAGGASAFPESTLVIGSEGCLSELSDKEFDFGGEVARRVADWEAPPIRLPVLVVQSNVTLADERNPVTVFTMGSAHTDGDLAVSIADDSMIYAGALLFVERNPYAGDGTVAGWLSTLNSLARTGAKIVVPLRGPAVDARGVREMRDVLAWLRNRVAKEFVDRPPREAIIERVLADDGLAERLDLESDVCFAESMVTNVVDEAIEHRGARGLP